MYGKSVKLASKLLFAHAATDRPVGHGDPDFLGARRIAAGLAHFLTNAKTEPPLTLAVTGDWGCGKSSLMNYLFIHLKREGLRPVWFNAWHHRDEQNVLASILAKVQLECIKPWWHPAGFWFRGRLWWRRHLLWKILMLITLFCFFFVVTWLFLLSKEKWHDTRQYARYLLNIDQPVMLSVSGFKALCPDWVAVAAQQFDIPSTILVPIPGKKPQPIVTNHQQDRAHNHFDSLQCETLHGFSVQQRKIDALNCVTKVANVARQGCFATPEVLLDNIERQWTGLLLPKDDVRIREALDFLQPDSPVPLPDVLTGWLAALIAALLFIAGKSMALLGLTSMQFFQTVVTRLRGVQQPIEKVGTRLLFERYFKDITTVLGKRRLVLFIDDLDRCDRDYTRQVLEVSNFLSTSGTLFIVIGMAPRYVLANVTLSFQETARAVHEVDIRNGKIEPGQDSNAGQSWFAQHYLQKLINIEVPVPKPDAQQVKALLKNEQRTLTDEDLDLERLEKSEKRFDKVLELFGKLITFVTFLGVTTSAIHLVWSESEAENERLKRLIDWAESLEMTRNDNIEPTPNLGLESKYSYDNLDNYDVPGNYEAPRINITTPSENFVLWPLWTGVSAVVFFMLLVTAGFLVIHKQDQLNDQYWWWLKPLLKRLKVTVLGPEVTQDSRDFTVALDIWYELIAHKDPTPRNIKAFKNHLRYLASRDNQSPENSREVQLVALATLFYVYPQHFDEMLTAIEVFFNDETRPSKIRFEEQWPDLTIVLIAHQKAFGSIPSAEDIRFFKSMTQDMQIHRPSGH